MTKRLWQISIPVAVALAAMWFCYDRGHTAGYAQGRADLLPIVQEKITLVWSAGAATGWEYGLIEAGGHRWERDWDEILPAKEKERLAEKREEERLQGKRAREKALRALQAFDAAHPELQISETVKTE